MPAKPIFIGGTGSHAGKSWVATAVCRYLYRMGHRVAPFKAQNMSNNSMACAGGGEIGRAQAAQAEACRVEPTVDMNPILLKPAGGFGSQVVLNGRPWRNLKAAEYYTHFDFLLENVLAAYRRLAERHDYVVIEGAGSVTELNLKHRDLVNLGLATRLNAPAILVSDIDRGGIFASVIGTFHLLEPDEAVLVRSFLVNRFRGDLQLFADGVRILEERSGKPCLGVFPFADGIYLDAEDSVSLESQPEAPASSFRTAVIRLPHISNFTDFRLLPAAVYLVKPSEERFDAIFLPGTKNTIEDLLWLKRTGFEEWLRRQMASGARVVGVCGGFQMLGETIYDPQQVESAAGSVDGLGMIPGETVLTAEKITRPVRARTPAGTSFNAYEIHMGVTTFKREVQHFATLDDGKEEGFKEGQISGTYLHGALEDRATLEELLGVQLHNVATAKDTQYDRLADWFAENVDQDLFVREYL